MFVEGSVSFLRSSECPHRLIARMTKSRQFNSRTTHELSNSNPSDHRKYAWRSALLAELNRDPLPSRSKSRVGRVAQTTMRCTQSMRCERADHTTQHFREPSTASSHGAARARGSCVDGDGERGSTCQG